jgi:hypothetical protein
MAISNLILDYTTFNYQNKLSFDYSGAGTVAEISVDYGLGSTILTSIGLLASNLVFDNTTASVCTGTATYTINILNGSSVIETTTVSCTNQCIPETPNIDFDLDCNTSTNKGFTFTLTGYNGSAFLLPYLVLKVYRSTINPSGLSLPNANYVLIDTVLASTSEYSDKTASPDTQYWYEVDYQNTLNGAYSNKRTSGPCTTLSTVCGNNFPLHEFSFDTCNSTCSELILSDLFNDDISFRIPEEYVCNNIASVKSLILKVWDNCYGDESSTEEINISTNSIYYTPIDKSIRIPLTEGVYRLSMLVTYIDNYGEEKQITQEQCVFICGDLKCNIARLLAKDISNKDLAPMYYSLQILAQCNQCASACELYNYLKNYENSCC